MIVDRSSEQLQRYHVTCDGVRLAKCFYADSAKGVALCVAVNADGQAYEDPLRPGEHAVDEHKGRIVIFKDGVQVAPPPADFAAITRAVAGG